MNITEYRAMKAQEAEQKDSETKEQPNVQAEPTSSSFEAQTETETSQDQGVSADQVVSTKENEVQQPPQNKIVIDGVGEVDVDELKNGYLRQSDYTKKTQELARQREQAKEALTFYEQIRQNPELAQQLKQQTELPNSLDPQSARIQELENRYYDLMLEREIETLQQKYPDFEVREVLSVAEQKRLTNLEDAYLLTRASKNGTFSEQKQDQSSVDVEALRQQIRADLLKELQSEANTSSIISSNDSRMSTQQAKPKISQEEVEVARKFKLTPEEYIKWRDAK